jgi:GxxExxY protein
MNEIIHREESHRLMGACFEVYKEKGCGFLEAVFQECLELELSDQRIPFVAHPNLALTYKGRPLRQTYTPDFICFDKIILEIKAVSTLADEHRAQVHHYLRATGLRFGILANFGHFPKLEWERIAL